METNKSTTTQSNDLDNIETSTILQPNKNQQHEKTNIIKLDDDDAASDVSTENFNKGERVLLDGKIKAKVAYFGPVHFSHDDDWVGIEFDEALGKHNGTVAGTEYFKCNSVHGLFVRSHRLQRTDSSGMITARVKSPYRVRPKSSASARSQELEVEEDIFSKAEHSDPLGFYEAHAGTIRSVADSPDELNNKLGRVVEEMNEGEVNYASPWIHSSRTPTPTHQRYGSGGNSTNFARKAPIKKPVTTLNRSRPYGITQGFGELD